MNLHKETTPMLHDIKIDKTYHDGNLEKDVNRKILKEKFFAQLQMSDIKIPYLLQNYKTDLNSLAEFNFFLKVVKQTHGIGIIQALVFLEDEEYAMKTVYNNLLSSENKHQFALECSKKKIGVFRKNKRVNDNSGFLENFFVL